MNPKSFIFRGLIFILALSVTGCAALQFQGKTEKQKLRARVTQLVQAKIDGDWDKVYSLLYSGYRQNVSLKAFRLKKRFVFKSFTIENIRFEAPDKALVKVKHEITMQGFDFKDALDNQTWVKENGKWFLRISPTETPFSK